MQREEYEIVENNFSVGKPEQIIRRNVEITGNLGKVVRSRIALVGLPIAYDAKTDIEVFRDCCLRETALFSQFH